MKTKSGAAVHGAYRLKPNLIGQAKETGHWLVKDVGKILVDYQTAFARYRNFDWKLLYDEQFREMAANTSFTRGLGNQLMLSHFVRMAEAYQIVSVWRVTELSAPAVRALNSNEVLSACVLCRSMLETAVSYILGAAFVRKTLLTIPWSKIDRLIFAEEIEREFTKLIFGNRQVNEDHPLRKTNILTEIRKIDKIAKKGGNSLDVELMYNLLSEACHPNELGFKRFVEASDFDVMNQWHTWSMKSDATGETRNELVVACLWAIAFTHWVMIANAHRIEEGKNAYLEALGRPLPV